MLNYKGAKYTIWKKGRFSRVYDVGNNVIVDSVCHVKQCISLGWFSSHSLIPDIKRIAYNVYIMPKYKQPRSLKQNLKKDQWNIYKELSSWWNYHLAIKFCYDYDDFYNALPYLQLSDEYKELLKDCWYAIENYTRMPRFEISPRNVAVQNGNLILLDCWFNPEQKKYEKTIDTAIY